MTTTYSTYADISSLVNNIIEASVFTLHAQNVISRTVTVFTDQQGMQPRKVAQYNSGNVRQVAEGEAVSPTAFDKTLLNTLTPARFADNYLLTDQRIATDYDGVRQDAAYDLGASFAEDVDAKIASDFTSLTGDTIGAAGGTISLSQVFAARSILLQNKVRGPFYCVVGAGQWYHLVAQNGTAVSSTFTRAQEFQTALIDNYFTMPMMGDITFVYTPVVSGAGGTACTGALYSRQALAYDQRSPFALEPQRNANRQAWELNASMWYAHGIWRPTFGVQLVATDVVPTTGI